MEKLHRPDLIEEAALGELADYRKQEERKRAQPSVEEKEAMEILLAKLKEEGIEAKGEVGFVTRLTTNDWNIIVRGTGNNKSRGTVYSYRNPESILSHNGGLVFSEEDVALLHPLVMDPIFDHVEFKDTAKIISYREESFPPTVKISSVQLCEIQLRNLMSAKPEVLSKLLNPNQDPFKKTL